MAKKIKIYSTPSCGYCHLAKDFLKEKNVAFEDIDVSQDAEAAKNMVAKTGQMGVPVIEVDDEIIVGFNQGELERLLS